jgi:nicotinate-nucleotide pyrophosphorylase
MKSTLAPENSNEPLQVLLIGNNPLELASIYETLKKYSKRQVIIDCCFDFQQSVVKALKLNPSCILLDDAFSKKRLKNFINRINQNNKTSHIPITLLKSNNYGGITSSGIQEYVLKDGISTERLYSSIINAIQFKRTHRIIKIEHRRRKRQLNKLITQIKNSIYRK